MLRLLLGILLIGASFVLLFMFIGDPANSPLAQQIQTAMHCKSGETFIQEIGSYVDNFGTSSDGFEFNFYCEDAEGEQRDVTGEGITTIIIAFTAPFIIGLLLAMWGIFAMVFKGMRKLSQDIVGTAGGGVMPGGQPQMFYNNLSGQPVRTSSATYMTVDGKQINPNDIPPEKMQQIQDVFKSFGMTLPPNATGSVTTNSYNMTGNAGADLVTQLRQLEDAKTQNLITQEEYDRLRKEILDKLT